MSNELKIGTQIYIFTFQNSTNFYLIPENVFLKIQNASLEWFCLMSWKLVRNYVTMHSILAFYMKTFPESTKCQSWKILTNELTIGAQLCYNAPHFSYISGNLSREYELSI